MVSKLLETALGSVFNFWFYFLKAHQTLSVHDDALALELWVAVSNIEVHWVCPEELTL